MFRPDSLTSLSLSKMKSAAVVHMNGALPFVGRVASSVQDWGEAFYERIRTTTNASSSTLVESGQHGR
jgi:hypothetical protein